uniref:Ara h 2 allergen n=1 Tax=Arachis tuberosa TaxID=281020 RepID=A0A5Q0V3X4_9FABA|nr:Ara h 2 allergen [Arachis tuberosa]
MAKLTILVALALFLLAAHASARQQWELQGDRRCQSQLERANLRPCEQHLMQKIQRDEDSYEQDPYRQDPYGPSPYGPSPYGPSPYGPSPYGPSPYGPSPRRAGSSQHQQRCCNELNEFENDQRCMCEALQQIMENQSDRLQGRQQEQQFKRELRNLPQQCDLRAPQRCDLDVESGGRDRY